MQQINENRTRGKSIEDVLYDHDHRSDYL